jgi:hypothetical protein
MTSDQRRDLFKERALSERRTGLKEPVLVSLLAPSVPRRRDGRHFQRHLFRGGAAGDISSADACPKAAPAWKSPCSFASSAVCSTAARLEQSPPA